jgi:hypothetical protein
VIIFLSTHFLNTPLFAGFIFVVAVVVVVVVVVVDTGALAEWRMPWNRWRVPRHVPDAIGADHH